MYLSLFWAGQNSALKWVCFEHKSTLGINQDIHAVQCGSGGFDYFNLLRHYRIFPGGTYPWRCFIFCCGKFVICLNVFFVDRSFVICRHIFIAFSSLVATPNFFVINRIRRYASRPPLLIRVNFPILIFDYLMPAFVGVVVFLLNAIAYYRDPFQAATLTGAILLLGFFWGCLIRNHVAKNIIS
jgi:hypothetical protein